MTDCGLKCFELRDTEYALAVEKENNQKLEAEVARLKNIIEQPCTGCSITDTLESSIDEMNYQLVNQNTEITNLKKQIEQLEAEKSKCEEYIDNLEYQLKDAGGELELWQRENAELKKKVLKWHKVTCFDAPDKDGFITNDNPSDVGCDFIIKLKSGTVTVDTLTECDCGIIFDNYDWEDIEAWCYIPEIKE